MEDFVLCEVLRAVLRWGFGHSWVEPATESLLGWEESWAYCVVLILV